MNKKQAIFALWHEKAERVACDISDNNGRYSIGTIEDIDILLTLIYVGQNKLYTGLGHILISIFEDINRESLSANSDDKQAYDDMQIKIKQLKKDIGLR